MVVGAFCEFIACFSRHCEHPRRVLIEADPGMGKTTFCEKMCLDWSTGSISEPFPSFPLVILLKCRDLATDDIMAGIADQLLPKDVPEKEALFNYIKANPSKVLLVVDGMDELKEVDLFDLIQGKILSQIYLLVSTRHEAGIKIRQYFDSLFEIVGYTVTDAKNYIIKYFKSIAKEDEAQCLLEKIDKTINEDGTARCHLPEGKNKLNFKYVYISAGERFGDTVTRLILHIAQQTRT